MGQRENEDDDFDGQTPEWVKELRKKVEADAKVISDLQAEVASARAVRAKETVSSILRDEFKINRPGIAKYVSIEGEPTKELVAAWLKDNGADFGIDPNAKEDPQPKVVDPALAGAAQADPWREANGASGVGANAPVTTVQTWLDQLAALDSPQAVAEFAAKGYPASAE